MAPVRFYTATSMSFEMNGQKLEVTHTLSPGREEYLRHRIPKPRTSWQRLLEEPTL